MDLFPSQVTLPQRDEGVRTIPWKNAKFTQTQPRKRGGGNAETWML